jgi:hypothetical protein
LTDLGLVLSVVLASKVKLPADLWRWGKGRILAPVSGALLQEKNTAVKQNF